MSDYDRSLIIRMVYEFIDKAYRIPKKQQQRIEKLLGKKILPRRTKTEKETVTKYWVMDEFGQKYCIIDTPWGILVIPEGGTLHDAFLGGDS